MRVKIGNIWQKTRKEYADKNSRKLQDTQRECENTLSFFSFFFIIIFYVLLIQRALQIEMFQESRRRYFSKKKQANKQKPKNYWTLKDALKGEGVFTIPTLKTIQSYKEYPMGALIWIFKRLLVVWRRKGSLSRCLACCQIISLARKPVSVDETKNGCTHAKVPVKVTPLFFVCTHHQLEVSSATPTAPDTWHLNSFYASLQIVTAQFLMFYFAFFTTYTSLPIL